DRHYARVGNQPVSRLHAVDPTEGTRQANGTALVSADRHIRFTKRNQDCAARRRSSGGIPDAVRIVHRSGRVCVASTGQAEGFAVCLTENDSAGIQYSVDDGSGDVWRIAFECRRAVHHWNASEHDVVLEDYRLPLELPVSRALDTRLVVPGVVLILVGRRSVTRITRIFNRRQVIGKLVDDVV